jgi:ABC-2 type transport system permease protein
VNSRNTRYTLRLAEEFKAAFFKDLRSYVRYPAWILGDFISTPLWFFFFAIGVTLFAPTSTVPGGRGVSYFYFGFLFIILFSTSVWGVGQSVRNEQTAGTLEQFFLSPSNRTTLILGRWARIFLTDMIIIGYTTLLVYLFGGLSVSLLNPALFLLSLAVYELSLIGFGLLMAGLTMKLKSFSSLSNLIFFGYIILTGALFPITLIPTPVRYVSMAIPFTYLNDIMRNAALGTAMILPGRLEYAVAILTSLLMLAFGFWAFNRIEQEARVKGSIATS